MTELSSLLSQVKACTLCEPSLPLGARPVLQIDTAAKILIVGQAPGKKVHETGVPFDDASGARLRDWLGLTSEQFYDAKKVAILPMGFCFPGTGKSGDLPPRKECASAWREHLLAQLPNIALTVVIGQYAQEYQFKKPKMSVTERVKLWRKHWPQVISLPHPSPRNNIWLSKNSWYEIEVIPELQKQVAKILSAK